MERGPAIITATGKWVHPLSITADEISVRDAALALSKQCRFNGHCDRFVSVAEHCCIVHDLVHEAGAYPSILVAALLHDIGEVYLSDIPKPLKECFGEYRLFEDSIYATAMRKHGLPGERVEFVQEMDHQAFLYEVRMNRSRYVESFQFQVPALADIPDLGKLKFWTHEVAYSKFIDRYKRAVARLK
jgi:hypothetical protein